MRHLNERLIIGLIGLAIILTPIWIYYNRHSILNRLVPFKNLDSKIAVDDIDALDWVSNPDNNEIFVVDTIAKTIRQITNDSFIDKQPTISIIENRVYFLSNRSSKSSRLTIHYYDNEDKNIHDAFIEFKHILISENAEIKDIFVHNDKISIVESYDSSRLYLVDLNLKRLINKWTVNPITVIIDLKDNQIITKQDGTIIKLTVD